MISGAVIGRDAELDFVRAFLDDVGAGAAGLVLSGEAGRALEVALLLAEPGEGPPDP